MKSGFLDPKGIDRKWYVVDAKDQVLGRVASKVANVLSGKTNVNYSPSHDMGDHVVVINANHVILTGNKEITKKYFSHSTYAGGGKELTYRQLQAKDEGLPILKAVRGMLPKNSRGRSMLKKLNVYGEANHPHSAQKPEPLTV